MSASTNLNQLSSRDRILARLRGALAEAPGAGSPNDTGRVPAHYAVATPVWSLAERLQRLVTAMRAVQTEVHLVRESTWSARLAEVVQAKGVRSLLLAPRTHHGALAQAALQTLPDAPLCMGFDRDIEHWKLALFNEVEIGRAHV